MSRKCLFLAKWTILAQLGAKIVGGLYHRTHSKSFSNFEAWYDAMIRKKLSVLNFQKNLFWIKWEIFTQLGSKKLCKYLYQDLC